MKKPTPKGGAPTPVPAKFDMSTYYVRTDGWRGYSEPIYAVAGANDTGTHGDSPCPSDVCEAELLAVIELLKKAGIKYRATACESSNVFCVHRYVVTLPADAPAAREIVKNYLAENSTTLLYVAGQRS